MERGPPESLRSWCYRKLFGFFPCYRRTGVRIIYASPDLMEVHVKLPLNWKTRGYNGTLFGGSMYACVDPMYMAMISWHLGKDYIAWDRAATIDFRKAGRSTLYSRSELESEDRVERVYAVTLVDADDVVHAAFTKSIVIRKRKKPAP
jgi:acyl-coenzyme A thioesterase PaaI-like protein